MKLNQFAVYRVDQQTAGKALWHLPYQEARQQNVSITVENYRLISIHEMQENEKIADIWKRTKNQCEVSDVLVLNKNGEISCYYVDENYPQYLAGFIRINAAGALITMDTEDYQIDGKKETGLQQTPSSSICISSWKGQQWKQSQGFYTYKRFYWKELMKKILFPQHS